MKQLDALALPLWGSRLIEASAGTGKTWTIAALYLRLVLGHGKEIEDGAAEDATGFGRPLTPRQILVMTFTRAATRELSDRIRNRLVDAARCFRGDATIAVDDEVLTGLVATCPAGPARESAAWRLATAAEAMDDAAVLTIDAWVQRMLREHAFDSGSLFDEEVQADDNALWNEAARDYWRQEVYPLGPDAVATVLSVWADDRELTDDVRVLGRLLPSEPNDHESLASILDAASTRRDALLAELKERWTGPVRDMRGWIMGRLDAIDGPFNKQKIKRNHVDGWLGSLERWLRTDRSAELSMTPAAVKRLSSSGLRDALKAGRDIELPTSFDALPTLIDTLATMQVSAAAMRRHAATRVAAIVQKMKRGAGTYGFDDMLARLDRALAGTNGERLRARIVAQYPVALIDEFQDTSPVQYRILDRLYRTADNDRATALLLIGDPKQSIYRFRGADIHSYLRAREAMADRHYFLTTNYRATAPLVGAINHLFGRAEALAEPHDRARGDGAFRFGPGGTSPVPFVPVEARGRRDAYVDARGPIAAMTLCYDPELSNKSDARTRFAERCAEHIVVSLADPSIGFAQPGEPFRRLGPGDITVLVRDRDEAYAMRRALRRRNVASAYLSDQDSVFSSDEAADLLRWLRAVADPTDARTARIAFATRLIDLPIARLVETSRDESVFEDRLDALKSLNGEWRRLGVLPMLRRSLHLLQLASRWLSKDDGDRRLTNYLHLAELLQAASTRLDGEQALIRWLAEQIAASAQRATRADEQVVRLESDAELVKVATVHVAKGLEYPVVYLPFACSYREKQWKGKEVVQLHDDDGERVVRFDPDDDDKRSAELEERQEDVRLLYVALTRARYALWLGVASVKAGKSSRCGFTRSAFGYLLCGEQPVSEQEITGRLHAAFDGLVGVDIVAIDGPGPRTRLASRAAPPPLVDAPPYAAAFERDWSIGSFSSLVRDLARVPLAAVPVAPEVEEELLSGPEDPIEHEVAPPSNAPRHRFPRGTLPGNFLHDQLEWLADQRFATTDPAVRDQLMRRCERQGWGARATDVATWMHEVSATTLPPIGLALNALPRILPEMEFWFPSERLAAQRIDGLCRRHLLDGRDRPALPERTLRGMLMGFADLVFEVDGRYWVLDYKSNALGPDDAAYTSEAIATSMAQHRYDVQAAVYLLALHRLLRQRLGDDYDPSRRLGGALYFFIRGLDGPTHGCHVVAADADFIDALDEAFAVDPSGAPA